MNYTLYDWKKQVFFSKTQGLCESNNSGRMVEGGEELFGEVSHGHAETRCIDARVAGKIFSVEHFRINNQLHVVFGVVQQAQNAEGAGGDV